MRKKYLLLLAAFTFLSFILFSYLTHKNLFQSFDFNITVKLQDHANLKFDAVFSMLSVIGSFEVATPILLVSVFLLTRKFSSFLVLIGYGILHFIEIYGKTFVNHLPPPHFMLRTEKLVNFPQFYVSAQNSYPSGHAARAAFLSFVIGFILLRSKKLSQTHKIIIFSLLIFYDLLMFASRPYLGEHWTTDVIGGALLGLAFSSLSVIFI